MAKSVQLLRSSARSSNALTAVLGFALVLAAAETTAGLATARGDLLSDGVRMIFYENP